MNSYIFSTRGKIKDIFRDVFFHGSIIAVSIYISRFAKLYYFTWIPILWSIYNLFGRIFYVCTTTFSIDENGLIVKSILNVSSRISWQEIKKLEVIRHDSKIVEINISPKEKNTDLRLWDDIENYEELFNEILTNVKKQGNIEIREINR